MSFDLRITNQSQQIEDRLKAGLYKRLHLTANKTKWIGLLSPLVGITSALLTIAMRIAMIAESLIKGIGNIFGSIFSRKCSFKKGAKQIFLALSLNSVKLPFSMLAAATGIFLKTIYVALTPRKYTKEHWHAHDPKAEFVHLQAQAELGEAHAMNSVGERLAKGKGIARDETEAVRWFEKAVQANDALGMANLAGVYKLGNCN